MPVCRYFQRGNCRNGDACNFDHPGENGSRGGYSRNRNPFEALNRDSPGNGGYHGNSSAAPSSFGQAGPPNTYKLDENQIRKDLTEEKPVWPFSCYGPAKDAPVQLFGGPDREISFEEWRLKCYELLGQGGEAEIKRVQDTYTANADKQIENVLRDIPGAIRFIKEGENKHPNRFDVLEGRALSENMQGFGGAAATQTGGFGNLNSATRAPNPFVGPAKPQPFGQPASSGSAFGTPATSQPFGQPAKSGNAFGVPANPQPFGQPASSGNAFGTQPNSQPFGQPANPVNPFARPANAQQGGQPAFGTPSLPGATPVNPFMRPANQPQEAPTASSGSPFGVPANPVQNAQPAFGAPSMPGAAPANPFVRAGEQPAPFGPGAARNAFGVAAPGNASAFQPNTTAAANSAQNPFSKPPASSPFTAQPTATAAAPTAAPSGSDFSITNHQIRHHQTGAREFDRQGHLVRFKGAAIDYPNTTKNGTSQRDFEKPIYVDAQRRQHRVWVVQEKDWNGKAADDPPQEVYTPALKDQLVFMLKEGRFKDGFMPEYPLPRADTTFDI